MRNGTKLFRGGLGKNLRGNFFRKDFSLVNDRRVENWLIPNSCNSLVPSIQGLFLLDSDVNNADVIAMYLTHRLLTPMTTFQKYYSKPMDFPVRSVLRRSGYIIIKPNVSGGLILVCFYLIPMR